MACKPIQNKIEGKYGGEAILRMSHDKAVCIRGHILSTFKYCILIILGTFGDGQRKLLIRLGVSRYKILLVFCKQLHKIDPRYSVFMLYK